METQANDLKGMASLPKWHLQSYIAFIKGYKQYKRDKSRFQAM